MVLCCVVYVTNSLVWPSYQVSVFMLTNTNLKSINWEWFEVLLCVHLSYDRPDATNPIRFLYWPPYFQTVSKRSYCCKRDKAGPSKKWCPSEAVWTTSPRGCRVWPGFTRRWLGTTLTLPTLWKLSEVNWWQYLNLSQPTNDKVSNNHSSTSPARNLRGKIPAELQSCLFSALQEMRENICQLEFYNWSAGGGPCTLHSILNPASKASIVFVII